MKLRILALLTASVLVLIYGLRSYADVTITQGAGTTIFDFTCFTSKHCPGTVLMNSSGVEMGSTALSPLFASISAASLPLPTGAATAANQATEIASLATIATNTGAAIPAGTNLIGNVGSATGSAPPSGAVYAGANGSGATGGLLAGLKTCDLHAEYDASDNGSKTLVTGVSGRKVYICGYILATGGTATNLKLREGSDADCATNGADLTPAYQLVANDKIGMQAAFWTGLAVSTNAYYVCVNASAGNAHQAELWYTIQ